MSSIISSGSAILHGASIGHHSIISRGSTIARSSVIDQSGAARYMIASNRFALATDWGINDTGFNAGDSSGRSGGNGTAFLNFSRRRIRFTTTWAPIAGRFLWANSANSINAILPGLFNLTIQRCEVRDMAFNLIDTIKWSGSATKTMAPNETVWSDAMASLAANTSYFLDVWYTSPRSAAVPSSAFNTLWNECNGDSMTDFSASAMPATGQGSAIGGYFGPSCFAALGWDGSPVAMIFGDSIEDGTAPSAQLAAARGDIGFVREAMGSATGGSWNYMSTSRYSSAMVTLYTDNMSSLGGLNVVDWIYNASQQLQSAPIFNMILNEHGRNSIGGVNTLGTIKGQLTNTTAKLAAKFPNIPVFMTTVTPWTASSGNMLWSDNTSQTGIDAPNTEVASGGSGILHSWNDYILSGAEGQIKLAIDTAAPCRGDAYDRWAYPTFASTLLVAIAANNTNVATTAAAPPVGVNLVFEPGVAGQAEGANSTKIYTASAVTANATAGWDSYLSGGRGSRSVPASVGVASRIAKAHASGVAVASSYTSDGLHPSDYLQKAMRDVLVAQKTAIKALIPAS